MAAVVAVGQRKVDTLVKAHPHSTAHQCADCFQIVINRILDILDFPAVEQFPKPPFQILLFNRRDILRHVTVEAVGNIGAVADTFDYAVLFAELLHL